ncbi:MAG: aspartate carbamoyltransferase catalytic subunit [Deltaproteobacteria bacterium]|nr:aspartate carbamoyltransferase catalytic subunit [Deltaproteobacteria bacterium]
MKTDKGPATFGHKHLLGIEQLAAEDITLIMETADSFKEISTRTIKKVPALRGKTVINLFYEPSTRTRTSFEIAEKRLSADSINIAVSTSAVVKGESLKDTVKTLMAMQPDIIVMRHQNGGAPHFLTQIVDASVINAGDGIHEHPTQALLDLFTIIEKKQAVKGLVVTIAGDIAHSRVARSNILCLAKMGATVRVAGPPTMIPAGIQKMGARVFHRFEEACQDADVVMMLRLQTERQAEGLFSTLREYNRLWGLSARMLRYAKKDAIVMHPGPMNRGVEIDPEIADGSRSVILDQVENGIAVRMAVLYLLSGGTGDITE